MRNSLIDEEKVKELLCEHQNILNDEKVKEKQKWKVVLDYFSHNPEDLLGAFPTPR